MEARVGRVSRAGWPTLIYQKDFQDPTRNESVRQSHPTNYGHWMGATLRMGLIKGTPRHKAS